MADPRWLVVVGMAWFYYRLCFVAYDGRRVATAATTGDRVHYLSHHKDSLWWLLCAAILLLVLVLAVVNLSVQHTYSMLFWVHESLNTVFLTLAALAIYFNGTRTVNHKYLGWSMVALTVPIGITGAILLSRLQF